MKKFKFNVSITDFSPLFSNLEYLFKGLKTTGVDGIELLLGVKSRWSLPFIASLSQKYQLPIVTLHQPVWSGLGLWIDKGFVAYAKKLNVKGIVIHTQTFLSMENKDMKKYFKKFAQFQEEFGIKIMLENSPSRWGGIPLLDRFAPIPQDTASLESIYNAACTYGFLINYDSAHASLSEPQKDSSFKKIYSKIGNIHLSSFDEKHDHLPLDQGKLNTQSFLQYLYKNNYTGLINLEIYYPGHITWFSYDFSAIKRSIDKVKSI